MHKLVRTVFSRLHSLDPEVEEAKLTVNEEEGEGEVKMTVTTGLATEEAEKSVSEDEVAKVEDGSDLEKPVELVELPELPEPATPPPAPRSQCMLCIFHLFFSDLTMQTVYPRSWSFFAFLLMF